MPPVIIIDGEGGGPFINIGGDGFASTGDREEDSSSSLSSSSFATVMIVAGLLLLVGAMVCFGFVTRRHGDSVVKNPHPAIVNPTYQDFAAVKADGETPAGPTDAEPDTYADPGGSMAGRNDYLAPNLTLALPDYLLPTPTLARPDAVVNRTYGPPAPGGQAAPVMYAEATLTRPDSAATQMYEVPTPGGGAAPVMYAQATLARPDAAVNPTYVPTYEPPAPSDGIYEYSDVLDRLDCVYVTPEAHNPGVTGTGDALRATDTDGHIYSTVVEPLEDATYEDVSSQTFHKGTLERKMHVGTDGNLRMASVRRTNPLAANESNDSFDPAGRTEGAYSMPLAQDDGTTTATATQGLAGSFAAYSMPLAEGGEGGGL